MDLIIKARDGPARICAMQINQNTVITPNILFLKTSRFKIPESADILLTSKNKNTKKTPIKLKNIYNDKNIQKINKKENILFII